MGKQNQSEESAIKSVPQRIVEASLSQLRLDFLLALAQGGIPISETVLQRSVLDSANKSLEKSPLSLTELVCHPEGFILGLKAKGGGISATYKMNLVVSRFVLNKHKQLIRLKINKTEVAIDNDISQVIAQMLQSMLETFLHTTISATPLSSYLTFINPLEAEINLKLIPGWRNITTIHYLNTSAFTFFPFENVQHVERGVLLKADLAHWKFQKLLEKMKKRRSLQ